jgi:predicted metal-binding protein
MNTERIEQRLAELPLYGYFWIDPKDLEFSSRIRWICEHECPMYGKTWACPPGVGEVDACKCRCLSYPECLMITTVVEVEDIADIEQTLATRPDHEAVTDQVLQILRDEGLDVYVLSTEACAICDRCAILDGQPCRHPERMHPCVESHGIVLSQVAEDNGVPFQYGDNVVTWFSLLFFKEK